MTMRVSCLIDSLNSGGAQRQMCILAGLLKNNGCEVFVVTYHHFDFFMSLLDAQGIPVHVVSAKSKAGRFASLHRTLRSTNPDVLISFLRMPNLLAELTSLPSRNFGLIVSERNTDFAGLTFGTRLRFFCHLLADVVVCNSFAQEKFMRVSAPWLAGRLKTIVNCVDLETFQEGSVPVRMESDRINLLVIGRFEPQKNPLALLAAVELLRSEHPNLRLDVDWYGNNFYVNGKPTDKSELYLTLEKRIKDLSLKDRFRLHPPVRDVVALYQGASVLCLPSLWEGCSNVVGEAMACGKPILAGRVGDNSRLVADGENGFLFDPGSVRDIASAILRFAQLPADEKVAMGRKSRQRAEMLLTADKLIGEYLDLIERIGSKYVRR